jgi:hypothetical protein
VAALTRLLWTLSQTVAASRTATTAASSSAAKSIFDTVSSIYRGARAAGFMAGRADHSEGDRAEKKGTRVEANFSHRREMPI